MSKQWSYVLAIVGGLGLGAWALVTFGPRVPRADVGNPAPDFKATKLADGQPVSLKKHYSGQVTLVNVWATYCIPCRTEMPAMEKLYREFGPAGFRIAAVSIDEGDPEVVKQFGADYKLSFDLLHDPSGAIERAYQTTGVPESFLIDKDGIIVKKVIGEHPWSSEANRRLIAQLVGVPVVQSSTDSSRKPTADPKVAGKPGG